MYKYPNGLTCAASERRVQWFERVVPPIAMLALLIGFILIPNLTMADSTWMLLSWATCMVLLMLWSALIVARCVVVFNCWCKPIVPHVGGDA